MPQTLAQLRPEIIKLVAPTSPVQADQIASNSRMPITIVCPGCGNARPVKAYYLAREATSLVCRNCAAQDRKTQRKLQKLRKLSISNVLLLTGTTTAVFGVACPTCHREHATAVARELRRPYAQVGQCAACRIDSLTGADGDERVLVACPTCSAERMVLPRTINGPSYSAQCASCTPRQVRKATVDETHPAVAARFAKTSPVKANEVTAGSGKYAHFICSHCDEIFNSTVANQTRATASGTCKNCRNRKPKAV